MTSVNLENNPTKPQRRTFFVADLKCYMCGSVVGSVESEQPLTAAPHTSRPVLVRQAGSATPTATPRPRRCPRAQRGSWGWTRAAVSVPGRQGEAAGEAPLHVLTG